MPSRFSDSVAGGVPPSIVSNAADAQAAYGTEMALWACMPGHANLHYHAAGWLEGGLCASFEKPILDVEMLRHMMAFLEPIRVDPHELAFEGMKGVSTGGHLLGSPHTMARCETAFYRPLVSNWQNFESGELAGAQDATGLWQRAREEYEQPP